MLTPFRDSVIAQKANDLRQFTYIFIFDNPTLCEQFVFQLFHLLPVNIYVHVTHVNDEHPSNTNVFLFLFYIYF